MIAVGVLGPLLVQGPSGPVRVGSARQRRLLVALAAHAGRVVTSDALVELVWPEPPADPAGALQTNVSRLRRLLPPGSRIETAADGYRLVVDPGVLDVTAFADGLAAAAAAETAARPDRYARVLALWRGQPFVDLDHPSVEPEAARLAELHASATEQYAAALLAVGRAGEAVSTAEALVRGEPLREGAVALLARGLVAAGRQGAALAALAALRTRLAEELGLDPSAQLRELEGRILRQELDVAVAEPPPSPAARDRLPRLPVSSFVGRDAELAAVAELLDRCRVVTLCGPGGVGKTRLALHVAAGVADRYDDGVLLVELGDGGPADVEQILAGALRLADDGAGAVARGAGARAGPGVLADRVVDVLAVRRQLVLIDNCEHVADEVAGLVEAITRGAPGVDLLLTSREPVRADAEQLVPVAPLPPEAAAALLADRLGAAAAGTAEPGADDVVPELCRRLDGLPLALELAAARAAALGLRGLLEALEADETFDVLRGGRRAAAPRHRSLADVVAWSHGLLDDPQRTLFERLSAFAGPVDRGAITAVCGDAAPLPDLVERSLVVRVPGAPDRFGMLETLRAFGRSRLAGDPTAPALRARHAAWAVALVEEVAAARRGAGEPSAVRRFDRHLADVRRAHAWLCAHGPVDQLLRLTVPIGEMADVRGRIDLVRLVEDAVAAAGIPPPGSRPAAAHPLAPRLAAVLASSGWQRGDLDTADDWGRHAVVLAEAAGEPLAARFGYEALHNSASFRGDLDRSVDHAQKARDLARAAGDTVTEVVAQVDLVVVAGYAGRDTTQLEADLLAIDAPAPTSRAWAEYALGEVRAERGDAAAAGHLAVAVAAAEDADSGFVAGVARHTLLTSAARGGDPAASLAGFGPLLDHWNGFGAWTQLWIAVRALVGVLSRLGRHRDAAVLLGAMAASPRATSVFGADSARLDAVEDAARAALGPEYAVAAAEGARLGDRDAVALARRLTRT